MAILQEPDKLTELFREIVKRRYHVEEYLENIEEALADIRKGIPLTYNHLELIADRSYWPFPDFWMWPAKEQIVKQLKSTSGWFISLPSREETVINDLCCIFKNISLVSIILRFCSPSYYAIYSRPPLYILRVKRGKTDTEEYLNYLYDLRLLTSA